jgi:hypothetical protein
MVTATARARAEAMSWLKVGVISGILAGIVYIVYEMVVAELTGEGLLMPLRRIGAMSLGPDVLSPTAPVTNAVIVGIILALVLSIVYGVTVSLTVAGISYFQENARLLVGATTLWAFLLYLVNYFFWGRTFWPWFFQSNSFWQFLGVTVFFGTVLGLLLAERKHLGGR